MQEYTFKHTLPIRFKHTLPIRFNHTQPIRFSIVYQYVDPYAIQEVFHVYLNKFENAVSHLFLVILGIK